jgi:hypothetical protein
MQWGFVVGIVVIALFFAFVAYIVFTEARTHRFWRRRVEAGDLEMITQLLNAEVSGWRTERPPKGMAASVWQGIQSVEVIEVGQDYVRASTIAEPQFALVGGTRRQVSSSVDEARRITAKLAERFFYDVPHVRFQRVQLDVFTTFSEPSGEATQRCIMSTLASRDAAGEVDWDADPPEAVAERLGAHYDVDVHGTPHPIQPDEDAVRVSANGAKSNGHSEVTLR